MPRSYLIFAVVSSALMMIALDGTIVTVALPAMLREMHTTLRCDLDADRLPADEHDRAAAIRTPRRALGPQDDLPYRHRCLLRQLRRLWLAPNIYVLILFRGLQAAGGGMFSLGGRHGRRRVRGGSAPDRHRAVRDHLSDSAACSAHIGGVIIDHLRGAGSSSQHTIGIVILALACATTEEPAATGKGRPRLRHDGRGLFAAGMFALLFGSPTWRTTRRSW